MKDRNCYGLYAWPWSVNLSSGWYPLSAGGLWFLDFPRRQQVQIGVTERGKHRMHQLHEMTEWVKKKHHFKGLPPIRPACLCELVDDCNREDRILMLFLTAPVSDPPHPWPTLCPSALCYNSITKDLIKFPALQCSGTVGIAPSPQLFSSIQHITT